MKKVEKSLDELMNSVTDITEDQLGKLQGGFTTIDEDLETFVPVVENVGCNGNCNC